MLHSVQHLLLCCSVMTFIGVTLVGRLHSTCLSFLFNKMGIEEELALTHRLRMQSIMAGRHDVGNVRQLVKLQLQPESRGMNGSVCVILIFSFYPV